MTVPTLSNAAARQIFLHHHALAEPPTGGAQGDDLATLIDRIGFVQVDSINTVARAHHMILFARRQRYRSENLKPLLETRRALFEHWTHDASILPMGLFPHWKHRFAHDTGRLHQNWRKWFRDGYETQFDTILNRIAKDGPVTSSDVGVGEARGKGGWWDWHPSKTALEWLWRTGALSISGRSGFQKIYDLTERVIPDQHRLPTPDSAESAHWACTSALDRLGFATPKELQAYWNAIRPEDAKRWANDALARQGVVEVDVQSADGSVKRSLIRPETLAQPAPPVTNRLRILSPFDPALRDRDRAERLFGFHYRIEVFVPEPKRIYGYYVFPVLEGAQIIGRIDVKAWREDATLRIKGYWPEATTPLTRARQQKLDTELNRLATFTDCTRIEWADDWLKDAKSRA